MTNSNRKVVVIPARLNSARLPNKVILDLNGKTIVQRVYEQALKAKNIDAVYIATDSDQVEEICTKFTDQVIRTSPDHQSGTDRIAEAVRHMEADFIVNVQGDEPFIEPFIIEQLAERLTQPGIDMATVVSKIKQVADFLNPNIVKAVMNHAGKAIYFSRSPIPFARDVDLSTSAEMPENFKAFRHFGIYGFTREFLMKYSELPQTTLEKSEKLEQLRVIENGYTISVLETEQPGAGIDTPEDLARARAQAPLFFNEK